MDDKNMSNGVNKKYILFLTGIVIVFGIFLIASKNTAKPYPTPGGEIKTYISNEIGIEMQYPEGFFYQEPAILTLDCKTSPLPNNCPQVKNGNFTSQNKVLVGGKTYCAQIKTEGAAGSVYGKSNFNIQNDMGCFSLELVVRTTNCGVYGMPEDEEYQNCAKENATKPAIFEKILSTFKDTLAKTDFGFIRKIETKDGKYFADFDNGVLLTGVAAEDAAIRGGLCTEANRSECIPNNYFIENLDRTTVSLEIGKAIEIQLETFETGIPGDQKEIITLEKFAELINDPTLNWKQLPYHLVIENNQITKISEQYVP